MYVHIITVLVKLYHLDYAKAVVLNCIRLNFVTTTTIT